MGGVYSTNFFHSTIRYFPDFSPLCAYLLNITFIFDSTAAATPAKYESHWINLQGIFENSKFSLINEWSFSNFHFLMQILEWPVKPHLFPKYLTETDSYHYTNFDTGTQRLSPWYIILRQIWHHGNSWIRVFGIQVGAYKLSVSTTILQIKLTLTYLAVSRLVSSRLSSPFLLSYLILSHLILSVIAATVMVTGTTTGRRTVASSVTRTSYLSSTSRWVASVHTGSIKLCSVLCVAWRPRLVGVMRVPSNL